MSGLFARKNLVYLYLKIYIRLLMRQQQLVRLRDAIASFKGTQKNIILMSPMQQVPIELEKEVVVLDFQLPDMAELNKVLTHASRAKSGTDG